MRACFFLLTWTRLVHIVTCSDHDLKIQGDAHSLENKVYLNVATLKSVCRSMEAVVDRDDMLHFTVTVDTIGLDMTLFWRITLFCVSTYYSKPLTIGVIIPAYKKIVRGKVVIGRFSYYEQYLVAELQQNTFAEFNQSSFYVMFFYQGSFTPSNMVPTPVVYLKELQILYVSNKVVPFTTEIIYVELWRINTITYCVYNLIEPRIQMKLDGISYFSNTSCASVHFKAEEKFAGMNLFVKAEEIGGQCQRLITHNYVLSLDPDALSVIPQYVPREISFGDWSTDDVEEHDEENYTDFLSIDKLNALKLMGVSEENQWKPLSGSSSQDRFDVRHLMYLVCGYILLATAWTEV